MCEFFKKLKNLLSSLLGNGVKTNISGRNSININGDVNIHIENIAPGSKGKIDFDNQTLDFIVASAVTEKIKDIVYTVCCIIIPKEKNSDILFLKGEFLPNQSIDLKVQIIDSQEEIKGGNYYLKKKKGEHQHDSI